MASFAYNSYEAVVNGVVGVVYHYFKSRRSDPRTLGAYGLEKAIINVIASYTSLYARSSIKEALDVEYLVSAVVAGLYHGRGFYDAAGDQLVVSIISHLISTMSSTSGADWFQRNLYGINP